MELPEQPRAEEEEMGRSVDGGYIRPSICLLPLLSSTLGRGTDNDEQAVQLEKRYNTKGERNRPSSPILQLTRPASTTSVHQSRHA
jgi:hypothetical protein